MKVNRALKIVIPALGLIASGAYLVGCTKGEDEKSHSAHQHSEAAHHDSATKEEIWTCPMHPRVQQDSPGKCPICHMDLVQAGKKKDGNQKKASRKGLPEGHAAFQLSDYRKQIIGVKSSQVQRREMYKIIEVPGRVAFDPELFTAQSEFLEAIRQLNHVRNSPLDEVKRSARKMVESAKLRLKVLGLSDGQINELRRTRSNGSNLLVTRAGEDVWVYAEVFEMDLPYMRPGLKAYITGGALAGQKLEGQVVAVDQLISSSTRTAKVRIRVSNAKGLLRPQSFVQAQIHSPMGEKVVVPFGALLDSGKDQWVFVISDSGEYRPTRVYPEFYSNDWVAIAKGVEPGDTIVTSANFLIDSESRLEGVLLTGGDTMADASPKCPVGQFWHAEMNHCMAGGMSKSKHEVKK